MADEINVPWRITKASTTPDGLMVWQATTTKFSRDVQRDYVTRGFYEEAIKRFESKATPSPFFSVAHYPAEKSCVCGHEFSSFDTYVCPQCNKERLLAGVTTSIWIDGEQPKAKGVFYPTALGKSVFNACIEDQKSGRPDNERVRISMGFYPDPDGVVTKSEGRDFVKGWIEHFAATRVPVIPDTDLKAELMEKSLSIKTKFDDAAAIVPKALADELVDLERRRRIGKSEAYESDGLIFKSQKHPVEVAQVEVLPEQLKTQAEMAGNTLKTAEAKAKDKKNPGYDEKKNKVLAAEEKSALSDDEIERSVLEDAAATLSIVQKAILAPGTDKQEVLARAANLIQSISEFAQAAQQSPANVPGKPIPLEGGTPTDAAQATNGATKVAVSSPTPNQSTADASLAQNSAQSGLANQQPATELDPNKTDETGLAAAIAPVSNTMTPDPMVSMLANQISTLSEEQRLSLAQALSGGSSVQDSESLDSDATASPADDGTNPGEAPDQDTSGLSPEDQQAMDELMSGPKDGSTDDEGTAAEEDQGADESEGQQEQNQSSEESDQDGSDGQQAEQDSEEEQPATDDEEKKDDSAEPEEDASDEDKTGDDKEEAPSDDEEADTEKPAAKAPPAEEESTDEGESDKQPAEKDSEKAAPKKKLTFSAKKPAEKSAVISRHSSALSFLKSMPIATEAEEKSVTIRSRRPYVQKTLPVVMDVPEAPSREVNLFEVSAFRKEPIKTEQSPLSTATKGNSLEDKLPSSWTSMGTRFISGEGNLGRIVEISQDGPIPTGRYVVTRYRGDDEGLAHPRPIVAMDINEAVQYANVWLSGSEVSRRAEEPVSGIPVAHTVVAHTMPPVTDTTAVGVKSRTEPDATVKSEGVHPVVAFMDRWAKQVEDVVAAEDGSLTRLQKREMVQKALDSFGVEITNMIDNHTPIAQSDVESVVRAAVQDAVDRVQNQNAQQIAGLEATVKSLMAKTVQGAVAQQLINKSANSSPRRKSLSAVRPQGGSEAVTKSSTAFPVLSGDQTEQVKFKASDAARVSVGNGNNNVTFRY